MRNNRAVVVYTCNLLHYTEDGNARLQCSMIKWQSHVLVGFIWRAPHILTVREGVEEGAEEHSTSAEVVEAGVRWAVWELHTASLAVAGSSWWQFHFGMVRTVVHMVQRWEERQLRPEGACR